MNILKQLGVSDIGSKTSKSMSNTGWRLAAVYVVVISLVIFVLNIATYTLYNQRVSNNIFSSLEGEGHEHLSSEEFQGVIGEELLEVMITIDIILFVLVCGLAYFLSRQALKPLDRAYNEQKRFLGDVAHELRTPLTVMKTGLESTLLKNTGQNDEMIRQAVGEIDYMSHMLNNLIFLIKNETLREYVKEKIDLVEIVSSEIEKVRPYANAKNIEIEKSLDTNSCIIGSENELRQVVKNLLKNAVDYNKTGGQIFATLKKKGAFVTLEIKDTGIGINESDKEKIFDRFFKIDASRSTNSAGLGLAIVKSIVQKHNGTILVKSVPGAGTSMILSFKKA